MVHNPAAEPVQNASADQARLNMAALVGASGLNGLYFRRAIRRDYGNGYFAFYLYYQDRERRLEIQMPGCPMEVVQSGRYPIYRDGEAVTWQEAVPTRQDFQ